MDISLESKLAIAFVRPFRSYIDGYNMFIGEKSKVESDIRAKIDTIIDNAKQRNPNINNSNIEYVRDSLVALNMMLVESYKKCYIEILSEVIDQLTVELEKEIKSSFTQSEIKELLEMVSNPLFNKMLQNTRLFGVLKKSELDLEYKLRLRTLADITQNPNSEEIKKIMRNLKGRDIRDDEIEDPDDEDFWQ